MSDKFMAIVFIVSVGLNSSAALRICSCGPTMPSPALQLLLFALLLAE